MKIKALFHYISYLQYPLLLTGLFFALKPYFEGINAENTHLIFNYWNQTLIFMGLAISFSTLQDTSKTQNKMSKNIWENPKKGKTAILLMSLFTFFLIIVGLVGYFIMDDSKLKELSIGVIVLSIGFMALLKTAIEMFENHRLDKKIDKYK